MESNPYYTFTRYLREKYQCRVFRISVDGFMGCPGNCIFCEKHADIGTTESIEVQIDKLIFFYKKRFKAKKFYLYLQKGTNTSQNIGEMKLYYEKALSAYQFSGFIIATRPDCISQEAVDLIQTYTKNYDVWVEYGLQSSHNETLKRIKRGHTYEDFLTAVAMLKDTGIKCTVHIILGLPGESREEIIATVKRLSSLPIQGIKFHHMYILENTPLHQLYCDGLYTPVTLDWYIDTVSEAIQYLPHHIVVHRVVGEDNTGTLVAPRWRVPKNDIVEQIKSYMKKHGRYQGKFSE